MAVVQTPFAAMTLGQQKIYNVIHQQHSPQQHHHHHQIMVTTTTGGLTPQTNKTSTTTSVIQTKRPLLAPAPERTTSVLVTTTNNNNNNINNNSSSMNPAGDLRCKRKIQFMPYGPNGAQQQPASVARRNARERNRVKQVNNGFATLRQHIPPSVAAALAPQGPAPTGRGGSKKLSKVETLRLAVEYIRSLKQMIDDHETDLNPANLTGSTMDNVRYYTTSGSPSSTGAGGDQYQSYPILLSTPTCSEASVSPTPSSHSSEGSFSATSGGYTTNLYHHHQENFENYEPKSPEDEELLDAIFSWQQTE